MKLTLLLLRLDSVIIKAIFYPYVLLDVYSVWEVPTWQINIFTGTKYLSKNR
jgi:hypothetical protein